MASGAGSIESFKDLRAWQESYSLGLEIYEITKGFPKEELYGLVSQMRRASVSVPSNVAEGFGRRSYKERLRFYLVARGSVTELHNQLLFSKDLGYISSEIYETIMAKLETTHKILNGLISKTDSFT